MVGLLRPLGAGQASPRAPDSLSPSHHCPAPPFPPAHLPGQRGSAGVGRLSSQGQRRSPGAGLTGTLGSPWDAAPGTGSSVPGHVAKSPRPRARASATGGGDGDRDRGRFALRNPGLLLRETKTEMQIGNHERNLPLSQGLQEPGARSTSGQPACRLGRKPVRVAALRTRPPHAHQGATSAARAEGLPRSPHRPCPRPRSGLRPPSSAPATMQDTGLTGAPGSSLSGTLRPPTRSV